MLKKIIVAVIFIALNIVVLTGTYLNSQKVGAPSLPMYASMPDFSWQDLSGNKHTIKELAGQPVIIHFWATWCGPCRREFPQLLASAASLDKKVTFLTVSGDDKKEDVLKFVKEAEHTAGVKSPGNVIFAFDPDKVISFGVFQTNVYPESILVDAKGIMRRKFSGAVNWDSVEMQDYLKEFTAGKTAVENNNTDKK